jgi:3-dehydroshikimate dehydratase
MIYTGLCSIAFRELKPQAIIDAVLKAGLDGIEWGGDVHVPHGDIAQAKEVHSATINAGLRIASYGSYYWIGNSENPSFESVLKTAKALGAGIIRVWVGTFASAKADAAYYEMAAADSRRIADMAAGEGIMIAYESHDDTLNDSKESVLHLLGLANRPNVLTYWQHDLADFSVSDRAAMLNAIRDVLANMHVFYWTGALPKAQQRPLIEGETQWLEYLRITANTGRNHYALIEHVLHESLEQFYDDARALKMWLEKIQNNAKT